MHKTIAFIGGGNMAGALIGGLIAAGHPPLRLRAAETDATRAAQLRSDYGIAVEAGVSAVVPGADVVVIAVKPQQIKAALQDLHLATGTVVLSIAAGIRLATLQHLLGSGLQYVRCMPNTPALVGAGISGLYAPAQTSVAARTLAEGILATAGATIWLEQEDDMDAVTALSGSGPAYFFLLTEVLGEAGTRLGLAPATAAQLARQSFIGAAAMAARSDLEMTQLRANVTSKGGTTEAAVQHLESGAIRSLFANALQAAQQRSAELGALLARDAG